MKDIILNKEKMEIFEQMFDNLTIPELAYIIDRAMYDIELLTTKEFNRPKYINKLCNRIVLRGVENEKIQSYK